MRHLPTPFKICPSSRNQLSCACNPSKRFSRCKLPTIKTESLHPTGILWLLLITPSLVSIIYIIPKRLHWLLHPQSPIISPLTSISKIPCCPQNKPFAEFDPSKILDLDPTPASTAGVPLPAPHPKYIPWASVPWTGIRPQPLVTNLLPPSLIDNTLSSTWLTVPATRKLSPISILTLSIVAQYISFRANTSNLLHPLPSTFFNPQKTKITSFTTTSGLSIYSPNHMSS